jgi:hypothetical protein
MPILSLGRYSKRKISKLQKKYSSSKSRLHGILYQQNSIFRTVLKVIFTYLPRNSFTENFIYNFNTSISTYLLVIRECNILKLTRDYHSAKNISNKFACLCIINYEFYFPIKKNVDSMQTNSMPDITLTVYSELQQ